MHLIVLPLPATQKRNSKREVNAQVVRLIESLKRQQKSVGLFQYDSSISLPIDFASMITSKYFFLSWHPVTHEVA